jgi:hypothetical protein
MLTVPLRRKASKNLHVRFGSKRRMKAKTHPGLDDHPLLLPCLPRPFSSQRQSDIASSQTSGVPPRFFAFDSPSLPVRHDVLPSIFSPHLSSTRCHLPSILIDTTAIHIPPISRILLHPPYARAIMHSPLLLLSTFSSDSCGSRSSSSGRSRRTT